MSVAAPKRAPVAGLAIGVLLLGGIVALGIVAAVLSQGECGGSGGPVGGVKGAPAEYRPIYTRAAAKYKLGAKGPSILAGIHKVETNFGGLNKVTSSAGAQGHMQFMPATWDSYGVDGDGDGEKSQYDPEDAIFSAANYLHASGAPGDWRKAIFAYNHAGWYVDKVMSAAKQMEDGSTSAAAEAPDAGAGGCGPVGSAALEGTPKHIIDTQVIPLAKKNKMEQGDTVQEVEEANAAHGPTSSGGRSDHQGPPEQAWAADMSDGSSPTPHMDSLADDLAKRFELKSWDGSGIASGTRKGYRFQMIYRDPCCGGHFDHVHFGVMKREGVRYATPDR